LSGVNEHQKTNIAASITMGKIDVPSYRMKDFPAGSWMYYQAWMVLKSHSAFKFDPPKQKEKDSLADFDEDEDTEQEDSIELPDFVDGLENVLVGTSPANVTGSEISNVSSIKAATAVKKCGPGPGKKATKAREVAAQFAAQQQRNHEEKMAFFGRLVVAAEELAHQSKKKTSAANMFVRNNARGQVFKMAYFGQKTRGLSAGEKRKYVDVMRSVTTFPESDEEATVQFQDDDPQFPVENASDDDGGNNDSDMPPLSAV
jgi:hypothetical protein